MNPATIERYEGIPFTRFRFGAVNNAPMTTNGIESSHQGDTTMPSTTAATKRHAGTNRARRPQSFWTVPRVDTDALLPDVAGTSHLALCDRRFARLQPQTPFKSHSGCRIRRASGSLQTALSKLPGGPLSPHPGPFTPGTSDRVLPFRANRIFVATNPSDSYNTGPPISRRP